MSKKPSLFVVERKEVFILGLLFLLSVALTFTVGVKYGEIVGRKAAMEEITAKEGLREARPIEGSTLGSENKVGKKIEEQSVLDPSQPADNSNKNTKDTKDQSSIESDIESDIEPGTVEVEPNYADPKGSVEDSDVELLEALQKAGIEKRTEEGVDEPATDRTGSLEKELVFTGPHFVIQVGSYPTKRDAERHIRRLQSQSLEPRILPSIESKNGRWFRVALGKYESRSSALKTARSYKQEGLIKDFFVRKVQ